MVVDIQSFWCFFQCCQTLNLTPVQLEEKYGIRTIDRLNEMVEKVVFENESYSLCFGLSKMCFKTYFSSTIDVKRKGVENISHKKNIVQYICLILYETNNNRMEQAKDINRLKVVLVEKKRTGKWLAEQLGKDPATISKWCTNMAQPGLKTLVQISKVLEVYIRELLVGTKLTM